MKRIVRGGGRRGMTLVELIVAFTILLILSTMALPVAKVKVRRDKEQRLRIALTEIREAIDRYKDATDEGIVTEEDPDNHGYPASLEILVEGVEANAAGGALGANPLGGGLPNGAQGGAQTRGSASGTQRSSSFGSRQSQSGSRSGSSLGSRTGSSGFGSSIGGGSGEETGKIRFLRRIPIDPMTGRPEWGMRSVSDPPDAMSWGGDNVFDVYSLSLESSMDGELYSEW